MTVKLSLIFSGWLPYRVIHLDYVPLRQSRFYDVFVCASLMRSMVDVFQGATLICLMLLASFAHATPLYSRFDVSLGVCILPWYL